MILILKYAAMKQEGSKMKVKSSANSLNLLCFFIITVLSLGCSHVAIIGSPYERYDHNRTQIVQAKCTDGTTLFQGTPTEAIYKPEGSSRLPRISYKDGYSDGDKLPIANVVLVFTGISLPLTDVIVGDKRQGDKTDLVDFLSTGPLNRAGVELPDMTGDHRATAIKYEDTIDFLSAMEYLKADKKQIIASLKAKNLEIADEVIETRYLFSSFADMLAFREGDFWFVLYKLPEHNYYSRLVVVPATSSRPSMSAKKPYREE
jgi:hypothetical protein